MSFARALPGLRVRAPVWGDDLPVLLARAIQEDGPSIIRFPRGTIPAEPAPSPPGVRWLVDPPDAEVCLVVLRDSFESFDH